MLRAEPPGCRARAIDQLLHHLQCLFVRQLLHEDDGLQQFAHIRNRECRQARHLQLLGQPRIAGIHFERDAGLVGDYLAYSAAPPPVELRSLATADDWAARLGRELAASGLTVRADYPVGRWTVDLCVEETGLICAPHPDGTAAHVERQRTLLRAGWTLRDAFASRWGDDATRAALDLASDLKTEPANDLKNPKD